MQTGNNKQGASCIEEEARIHAIHKSRGFLRKVEGNV